MTLSEGQGHQSKNRLYRPLVRLSSQQTWWALLENFLKYSNDLVYISVWPWTKVKINIINTWCIIMSEAVIVLNLMTMTTDFNTFWGIACEGQAHADTHTQTWLGFLPYIVCFANKKDLLILYYHTPISIRHHIVQFCVVNQKSKICNIYRSKQKSPEIWNSFSHSLSKKKKKLKTKQNKTNNKEHWQKTNKQKIWHFGGLIKFRTNGGRFHWNVHHVQYMHWT